jgi:hypothetical protein
MIIVHIRSHSLVDHNHIPGMHLVMSIHDWTMLSSAMSAGMMDESQVAEYA